MKYSTSNYPIIAGITPNILTIKASMLAGTRGGRQIAYRPFRVGYDDNNKVYPYTVNHVGKFHNN